MAVVTAVALFTATEGWKRLTVERNTILFVR